MSWRPCWRWLLERKAKSCSGWVMSYSVVTVTLRFLLTFFTLLVKWKLYLFPGVKGSTTETCSLTTVEVGGQKSGCQLGRMSPETCRRTLPRLALASGGLLAIFGIPQACSCIIQRLMSACGFSLVCLVFFTRPASHNDTDHIGFRGLPYSSVTSVTTLFPNKVTFRGTGVRTSTYLRSGGVGLERERERMGQNSIHSSLSQWRLLPYYSLSSMQKCFWKVV